MKGSYLRRSSCEAQRGITKYRRFKLRRSLMRNQGLSQATAKELATEAVKVRKPKYE